MYDPQSIPPVVLTSSHGCHSVSWLSSLLQELVVFANDTGYWPETLFYFNGTRVEPMVTGTVIMRAGEEGGTSLPLCYPITFEGE